MLSPIEVLTRLMIVNFTNQGELHFLSDMDAGPKGNCEFTDRCWTYEHTIVNIDTWIPGKHIDVPLDVLRDIQKDIQLYKCINRQTNGCTDLQKNGWMYRHTDRCMDAQTC